MFKILTAKEYENAERGYHGYTNCLNADNKSYVKTDFETFQKNNCSLDRPDSLVNFHNWLDIYWKNYSARCIRRKDR